MLNASVQPIEEVFILVLIGSLASLLLNKSLPISARKAKNRQRIAKLEEQAQLLTVFEKDLRDKLAIDLIRAKALNDNTKFLTPSALDRLSSVDTILDKIGKDILTRQEISQCYIDLDAEDGISYSDNKASTNPILKQSSGRKAHFTFCPILLIRRSTNRCDLSLNSQGMTSISLPSGAAT